MKVLERLRVKLAVNPETSCWEWTGCRDNRPGKGYGYVRLGGKTRLAHRALYQMFVGPIPDGLQVDHLCRNTGCVNPEHLEAVTPQLNVLRSERAQRTHCPKGHVYDDDNTYIRPDAGHRDCRRCKRDFDRRQRQAVRALTPSLGRHPGLPATPSREAVTA